MLCYLLNTLCTSNSIANCFLFFISFILFIYLLVRIFGSDAFHVILSILKPCRFTQNKTRSFFFCKQRMKKEHTLQSMICFRYDLQSVSSIFLHCFDMQLRYVFVVVVIADVHANIKLLHARTIRL